MRSSIPASTASAAVMAISSFRRATLDRWNRCPGHFSDRRSAQSHAAAHRPLVVRLRVRAGGRQVAPASEPMVNLVNTIRLYKEAGTEVVLNAMGD